MLENESPFEKQVPVIVYFYKVGGVKHKLMEIFSGGNIFHTGILRNGTLYEMRLMRSRRPWLDAMKQAKDDGRKIAFQKSPVDISEEYLIGKMLDDNLLYGVLDYLGFIIRPIYHFLGFLTRNTGGVICSELVYDALKDHGWPYRFKEVPSPSDLYKALGGKMEDLV